MDKQQQIDFVKDLATNVANNVIRLIDADKIPENWNGVELRWMLADKFKDATMNTQRENKARYKAYKNDVIVNNL
jgi:hypothetical protein